MRYYLGIDIGASSGRHMLAHIENTHMVLEEIYRFENKIQNIHNRECWNIDTLYAHVLEGIRCCVKQKKIPYSMSIDTWACDFVLCDMNGTRLCDCVSYRDKRVDEIMEQAFVKMDKEELYERTGIQFQKFNTLYQLLALQKEQPDVLAKAAHFLMIPDYLNYRLTGVFTNEYTNATSTQLVNIHNQCWDEKILSTFHLPLTIFHPFVGIKETIGDLRDEVQLRTGCDCRVIACASHDTASAYASCEDSNQIIISSGTWSLVGVFQAQSIVTNDAMQANFTNEGSHKPGVRFLKNVMGLWLIQEVQRHYENLYSFAQFVEMAEEVKGFLSIIDVNDECFLHPKHMVEEIQSYCERTRQQVPRTPGEIAFCVFHSLAISYQKTILEIESFTKKSYHSIHIVGGGSQNVLLNKLVETITKKRVIIGSKEATVIGNIMMQIKEAYDGNNKEL